MESHLLSTKVQMPPPSHNSLLRQQLINELEREIRRYKLILLSTPAGYGKTTLLSQWASSSELPITWLSLSEEENDPERFLRYLFMAWAVVMPAVRESVLGRLLGTQSPNIDLVLIAFVNAANESHAPLVFVLDDYQLIENTAVHQSLTFLLEHLPRTLHFVLAGRVDPPLPLARYRAHGLLLELRTQALQFLPNETAEFLNQRMGLNLSDDQVMALHTQMEGWIAGLQLAALSLRHRQPLDPPLVSSRNRYIGDYLNDDILAQLDSETRGFLLQTSILDRLCTSLCEAVTGDKNSQQQLEVLEQQNLFLMPLDSEREWFRYHRLFADFLHRMLLRHHSDEVVKLHRKAAQ